MIAFVVREFIMYRTIPVSVRNIKVLRELGTIIPPDGTTRVKLSSTVDENDKRNEYRLISARLSWLFSNS